MSTTTQQSPQEIKPVVCETNSVPLSVLIKQYTASLQSPDGWRILAIDHVNDAIVLIREKPTQQDQITTTTP